MGKTSLDRDTETLQYMFEIYCKGNHGQKSGLCDQCAQALAYSLERTARCPHEHKGNCKECTIHCYKPEMRAAIKAVMGYSGPRMTFSHPALTARYVARKISGRSFSR